MSSSSEEQNIEFPELLPEQNPPTNYSQFVTSSVKRMFRQGSNGEQSIDQDLLRRCITLSSSYLVADVSGNPEQGVNTWFMGFNSLVDLLILLHDKKQLQLETINTASKACSECWSVANAWKSLEGGHDGVKKVASKLKKLLDENGRTYRGERVYAP